MSSSQPLYLVIEENSTEDRAFLKSSESTETADASSPSKLIDNETSFCCGNGLASGRLFRLLCKLTGVWNPRKTRYAVLCSVFVLLNVLSLLAMILIPSICGPFVERCVTHPKRVTSASRNASQKKNIQEMYKISLVFDACNAYNAFSDTMTCILLVYTLWRMQVALPSFSLSSAHAKVKPREWLVINTMSVASSLAITTASALRIAAVEPSKTKFYGTFGAGLVIVYLTAFSCCCVFAVLSCALGCLVDKCFMDICNMTGGNLNDVTDAHQKLCKQLSTACRLLKPWFLVHWFMFGANCLVVFAFDFINISLVLTENGAPIIFMAVVFLLNFLIFLVPCVYASRVTWKCDELLFRVNSMSGAEWNEGHPFRQRAAVNEFIFYAERSKCGFRIGTMTFGSSATWISVLLGLLGLGVRLVTYIT